MIKPGANGRNMRSAGRPIGKAAQLIPLLVHDCGMHPLVTEWDLDWPAFGAWDPATWSAAGSVMTAGIALGAALIAWRQVRESRRLRLDQAAPYVVAFLDPDPVSSHTLVDLVIKNFGTTAAYDVTVNALPGLRRSSGDGSDTEPIDLPSSLRTLVPGQEWRTLFDNALTRPDTMPKTCDITVKFFSHGKPRLLRRGKRKRVRHDYTFTLDWAALESRMFVIERGVHDIAKDLRTIRDTVKRWSEGVGGLKVFVRNGDEADKRWRARREKLTELEQQLTPHSASGHDEAPSVEEQAGGERSNKPQASDGAAGK